MKVIVSDGLFHFSREAKTLYEKLSGMEMASIWDGYFRDDPVMVNVVEELGMDANGPWSHLGLINVPDGYCWHIEEIEGTEYVVLEYDESYLRELIRSGDEEAIVNYVKRIGTWLDEDEEDDDEDFE
jgi:hypothetical protein